MSDLRTTSIRLLLWGLVGAGCAPTVQADPDVQSEPDDAALPDSEPPDAALPDTGPASMLPHPDQRASWIDLTAFMDVLLDESGRSPLLSVDVPDDAVSLALVVRGSPDLVFVTEEVIDPEGRWVVSPETEMPEELEGDGLLTFPAAFFSDNRAYWAPGAAVTLIPNNPGVALIPGTWKARVAAVDALGRGQRGLVDVRAQVKRRTPGPVGHWLALHFYFSGSGDLSAAWAAHDPAFRTALDTVAATFADAGVEVGGVSFQDIDTRWQWIDASRDLTALYGLSEYDHGVHVFFVDRIDNAAGDLIGGLSGGVPGPTGMPGSPRSGVVVAHTLEPDPERLGLIVAHEVGHYLGLFHTAEMVPGYTDQLPDTPDDDRARRNVMYPVVGSADQYFTGDQAAVLQRGPTVLDVDID